MQKKEEICLTGLLLGAMYGCITNNPHQNVLQCNRNIPITPSAGKVMVTVFRYSQGVLLAHFQKRAENVNFSSYCEVLLKLRDAIRRKLPGQLARVVHLCHDNTRHHTVRAIQEGTQLQWELLEHPPYSPDLASSNFHLFGPLKNRLGGKCFTDHEEVETEVRKWLRQ
jgi:histone-lysine N-methyltransferase SETMAR